MSTTRKARTTRTVRVERDAVGLREARAPVVSAEQFQRGDDVRTGPFPRQRATFVLEHNGEALLSTVIDGKTRWWSANVSELAHA